MENQSKRIIASIVLAVLLFVSIFIGGSIATKPETYDNYYKLLDEKRNTVTKLVAAVATTSAAVAMLPGDATTPVANQIASLSKYLIVVIGAIVLEKILLTAIGGLSFKILLPIACVLGIIALFWKKEWIRNLAIKIGIISLVIVCIVPLSIKISDTIEHSSKVNLEQKVNDLANEKALDERLDLYEKEQKSNEVKPNKGLIPGIVNGTKDMFSNATGMVKGKVKEVGNTLNNFIEQITVLIITSCIIPLLVLMSFIWAVKIVFSVQIPTKQVTEFIKKDTFKTKNK